MDSFFWKAVLGLLLAHLTISPVSARHVHRRRHDRRYDLDDNGTPDICQTGQDGTTYCELPDGSWVSVATPTYNVALVASTASSRSLSIAPPSTTATSAAAQSSSASNVTGSTAVLPDPTTFANDNGTKWSIEYVGNLNFTDALGRGDLQGDKCRSSVLGEQVIWNCGDMTCSGGLEVCGFSMGPAFYGTDSVMTVNTTGATNVNGRLFAEAWPGDQAPISPYTDWGMDTTNVAAINSTTGIAYAWEIWRGAPDNLISDRGLAAVAVTLGELEPIATRTGPLLAGPDAIQLGLLTILRDGDYVYSYSIGGPSGVVVGRVSASDDAAFDASQYEFLEYSSSSSSNPTWSKPSSNIPVQTSSDYGALTTQSGGFGCSVYGSIMYSTYLGKYILFCSADELFMNFYTADNPWGPWSDQYQLLNTWQGYGLMAHPQYSSADGKDLYISMGPNGPFYMFKVTFGY